MSGVPIAICTCTLDRPQGLGKLLAAIGRLDLEGIEASLVVVDNSAEGSARATVDAQAPDLPLVYVHEPRRGYATARNALLDATPREVEWMALVDDDEIPERGWLRALLRTAKRHEALLVCGPVRPAFEVEPPAWMVAGRFFELGPFEDGAPATYVSTNNALVHAASLWDRGWRFHEAFDRTGGEDEHFFRRAMAAGLPAVTSADALVVETIPAERTTLAWLIQRHRRMGRTIARIDRMEGRVAPRLVKALGWLVVGGALVVSGAVLGRTIAGRGLCRLAWAGGSLEELVV